MQTLTSTRPTFRYRYRSGTWDKTDPKYLAARNVLVAEADPELLGAFVRGMTKALAKRGKLEKVGEFEMHDFGESRSIDVLKALRSVLQPVLGERSIRYLSADYSAIAGGSLAYHHDMPYSGGIFGAWCIEGPERVVRFSEMDIEVPFKPGTLVVFDPAQPHGLLGANRVHCVDDFSADELVGMVGFVAKRTPKSCAALGIEAYGPRKHRDVRTTPAQYEVCPATGTIPGLVS